MKHACVAWYMLCIQCNIHTSQWSDDCLPALQTLFASERVVMTDLSEPINNNFIILFSTNDMARKIAKKKQFYQKLRIENWLNGDVDRRLTKLHISRRGLLAASCCQSLRQAETAERVWTVAFSSNASLSSVINRLYVQKVRHFDENTTVQIS